MSSVSRTEWCCLVALLCLTAPARVGGQEPSPAETAGEVPTGVLTKPPELVRFVDAEYPPEAFAAGTTGEVVLRLTIGPTGTVDEVVVDQAAGHGFDEAAVAAARRFQFSPAEIDGVPAAVQILYRYAFTVEKQAERAPAPVDPAAPTGVLTGVVLERGTRAPLAGVAVRAPVLSQETYTDADGRFTFEALPVGSVQVQVDDAGYYAIDDEERVEAGRITEVRYYAQRRGRDDTVVVVGRRVKKEVARRTLTMEEIRKIPGTSGDALKVVQNLPGVARVPFGGGALVIRGSNPGDSGALINRHFIPLAFHFGGLRSVFPSELLESIDFYPGNFGTEFGRFSGGLVDVRVRRPKDDRLHGRVEADIFDAGVLVEGPLTEHSTFALGGRRSYIDAILPAVLPSDGAVSFAVAPFYYDYQALYDWRRGAHRLRLYVFGSQDITRFALADPADGDPAIRGSFKNDTSFYRIYAAWDAQLTDAVSHQLSATVGKNTLAFSGGGIFDFFIDLWVVTVRDDLTVALSKQLKLRGGVDANLSVGRLDISAPEPPKEGARGTGAPPSTRRQLSARRDFQFLNPALWTEAEVRLLGGALLLVPGLRVEYDKRLDDWAADPRLTVRYTLDEATALKVGVGLFTQVPSPDESDPDFGNPDIKLERAVHYSGGVERRLSEAVDLDVVGFYKQLYDQVSRAPGGAPPGEAAGRGVNYQNVGAGRIYGLEVLLRHNLTDRFFGWVSYTLMRSERRDGPGEPYRLFDLDQTHILTVLGQYRITGDWEVGGRFRYTTGNPYTPLRGGIYNADADLYVAYPGATNSARLAGFQQLDLRVDRRFTFDTWILTTYLEIQNVYNSQNPETVRYNYDFTEEAAVTGLPVIPSLGLRGEF